MDTNGARVPEVEKIADKPIRILTGDPKIVESDVNRALANDYAVMSWNWAVVHDELVLSAILVSGKEIRKAQIAQAAMQRQR